MPVTRAQARGLNYRQFTLRDADFIAGRDDDNDVNAGEVAEIGIAEVGDDGQLSNYLGAIIGQRADSQSGDVNGNEVFVDLKDSDGADVAQTTDWAFAVRDKGQVGGGQDGMITGFRSSRDANASSVSDRPTMNPQTPIARDGKVLQFLVRDDAATTNVSISDTTLEIPALGGQD